ncbi:MAG: hypothetical protein ACRDZQ_05805, partial [Acidimicrobiales bacterium]
HIGEPSDAVSFDESPEGHHLRFDANARLVGITLVGVRQDLEAGRKIVVTLPGPVEIDPGQLQLLTTSAA